jgi:chlorobactene glucosyltransferase
LAALLIVLLFICALCLLLSLLTMMRVAEGIPHARPDASCEIPAPPPLVSVIVPARNEERRIGECLQSLLEQDYPAMEVIVVDDRSTDGTAALVGAMSAADPRVRLVAGADLPPGWLGKPHALWQGVRHAAGEYLCFVDADTRLHPRCVGMAVSLCAPDKADLLTFGMKVECPSFWEKAVQPLILQMILAWFPADKINDPSSEVASANGPFLFFRRAVYEALGGHEAVREEIVEDLELARKVKKAGYTILWVLAPELVRIRMYQSLKEIWEGWSKNFYKSMGERLWLAPIVAAGILWFFLLPWVAGAVSLAALVGSGMDGRTACVFSLSLVTITAAKVIRRWMHTVYGVTEQGLLLQPLGALVVVGILVNSTIRTRLGKGLSWKGRAYPGGGAVSRPAQGGERA